jgi:hypothetical protein
VEKEQPLACEARGCSRKTYTDRVVVEKKLRR